MNNEFRIIIIDDNLSIHKDFIKILTRDKKFEELNDLDAEIFGKEDGFDKNEIVLPEFKIDTASQGQEGVEKIKEAFSKGESYSLAFVDVRMPPGWDGLETIKHIWEIDPDMQVVICTAYSDYSWEETVEKLGTRDNLIVLKKPFDNVAVRQLACALTKKWQLQQETRDHAKLLEQKIQSRTNSLQNSLSITRATLESSADGILVVDLDDKVVDCNDKFIKMWKIPKTVISGKNNKILIEYISEKVKKPEVFFEKLHELKEDINKTEINFIHLKDERIFEVYSQPQKLEGKTIGRVWSYRDVTQKIRLEEKLEYQATHDILTGLPNRILLIDRLQQAISKAKREKRIVAVLFFDLDRFKLVNDSLSHEVGDKLLISVARRLESSVREADTLARLGGDEFIMVLPDLSKEEDAFQISNKLIKLFANSFAVGDREISITSSVGVSLYPKDAETSSELLRNSDLAMYRAKELGANQIQFYTRTLNLRSMQRFEQEAELRRAIDKNEFYLVYQPQFDLNTKTMIAVEALIRWNHPEKGVILPLEFIPLAEEVGLIIPIGDWVLREACQQSKSWQDKGFPPIQMAVNVTTPQLKQANFVESVKIALSDSKLDPKYLSIELTENVIINNTEIVGVITGLRELGVQIILDDFGTGTSSLSYLRKISVDRLKIDKSFVQNIDLNRNDEVIIRAIIALAKSLNLEVLAEGVETQDQLKFLQDESCMEFQGFYFSRPLVATDLEKLLIDPPKLK